MATDESHKQHAARIVRDELTRQRKRAPWLASKSGLSADTVRNFLKGFSLPQADNLARIEAALGWQPGEIRERAARENNKPRQGHLVQFVVPDDLVDGLTAVQMHEGRILCELTFIRYAEHVKRGEPPPSPVSA